VPFYDSLLLLCWIFGAGKETDSQQLLLTLIVFENGFEETLYGQDKTDES